VVEEDRDVEVGLPEFVRDPIGMLQRRWLAMLAALVVGMTATAVVTATRTPLYSAKATVMLVSQEIHEDFVRPTIDEDATGRIDALVGEVLSIRSLAGLIENHDLYPELRAQLALAEVIALMRTQISVVLERQLAASPTPRLPTQAQTTHILAIGFSHADPEKAATVANALADLVTEAGVRTRTERASKTTEFLRRELSNAETALREVSHEISRFQQEHRGELPSELEASLRRLERLQQQRQSLATQIGEAETRLAMATAQTPDSSPEAQLEQTRGELARERAVNTETHPNVASLRRQAEALERIVNAERAAPATSGESLSRVGRREIDDLRAELVATERELRELDGRVAQTPARAEQLAGLEQQQKVVEETHLDLLRKVKEAEIAESLELAQQGERMAILDRAEPPAAPDRTRWKVALAGVAASLGLALCAGILLEWWDPVLSTVKGVEAASGLPVLGSVPRIT
jgi:uncharacterized protein involved in exopolysaccharide biosynthesis